MNSVQNDAKSSLWLNNKVSDNHFSGKQYREMSMWYAKHTNSWCPGALSKSAAASSTISAEKKDAGMNGASHSKPYSITESQKRVMPIAESLGFISFVTKNGYSVPFVDETRKIILDVFDIGPDRDWHRKEMIKVKELRTLGYTVVRKCFVGIRRMTDDDIVEWIKGVIQRSSFRSWKRVHKKMHSKMKMITMKKR